MVSRGFACIGLFNPKCGANVGGVMRAAGVYGADMVALSGNRPEKLMRWPTDTMKAWRHIPTIMAADLFDALPFDCVPVAVDLVPDARPLPGYKHPERAMYIFGPEDGTLGKAIVSRCRDAIMVPGTHCMNLAATVNVILYDRMAKAMRP